jgi:hypothetical protein
MLPKKVMLLAAGTLAGCTVPTAGGGHPTAGNEPAQSPIDSPATAHVDENLARLKALNVVEVGQLIVDLPAEATACYGPCPGSEPAIAGAKAKAALRLAELADTAERAPAKPATDSCAQPTIDANLAALQALRIVSVSGLIVTQPNNNGNCYDLPCPEDFAAAKAATCERAGKLAGIVEAASGL